MRVNLSFIFLLLLAEKLFTQPILTNSNHSYAVNEAFFVNNCNYQYPGIAGANQVWDFSMASPISTKTWITMATVGTPTLSNSADITLFDSIDNRKYYYSFFNDSSIARINDEFASSCVQYHVNLYYPFSFNDSVEKYINCQISPTSGGMQNYKYKYDGYGTVILPNGSYNNVARVKYISNMSIYDGFGTSAFKGNVNDTTYVWFLTNLHYPIAKLKCNYFFRYNDTPLIKYEFSYLSNINISVQENADNEQLYNLFPNPSTGLLNIYSKNLISTLKFEIVDLLGKIIYSGVIEENNKSAIIDISSLNNGIYFIQLIQKNTTVTKKIVVAR